MDKYFLDFIKSGQRFYRGYIQRLGARFNGIRELESIVHRLTLSSAVPHDPINGRLADLVMPSSFSQRTNRGLRPSSPFDPCIVPPDNSPFR